jgi:methyl-accepting chemotaxis protein
MGIRKMVSLGFLCLGLLLVGAGVVSFFELNRVGKRTQQILEASNSNMAISRELLDGAEMQHLSLLNGYTKQSVGYDSLYLAGRKMVNDALARAHKEGQEDLDAIEEAFDNYDRMTRNLFLEGQTYQSDWLLTTYWDAYTDMTTAIKEFMTDSEQTLAVRAGRIEQAAYRAITPSLVTTGVVLLLLFVLLYFIDFYYMKPVIKLNKGVAAWLKFRAPFNVTIEGRDETLELKNNIEQLIDVAKRGDLKNQ